MFGFCGFGVYAWGEFPPLRTRFALTASLSILPAIAGRLDLRARYGSSIRLGPR